MTLALKVAVYSVCVLVSLHAALHDYPSCSGGERVGG